MYEQTYLNYLEHDINHVYYNPISNNIIKSFKEECLLSCEIIYEKYKNINLCLSGGVDSEIMARCFIEKNIPFKVSIMKFNKNLNYNDIKYAIDFCEYFNLKYYFLELDIEKFFNDGVHIEYFNNYQCTSPQFATYIWMLSKLNSEYNLMADIIPITGYNKESINKLIENETIEQYNVYYSSFMTKKLKLKKLNINEIQNQLILSLPNHCKLSLVRYLEKNNMSSCPLFFKYRPEHLLSFVKEKYIQNTIKYNIWSYNTKINIYNNLFNYNVQGRFYKNKHITGFMDVKKYYLKEYKKSFDELYRKPLINNFNQSMNRILINLNSVINNIKGNKYDKIY